MDSTDTTCCVTVGDHWSANQHHWKSEANEDHQLNPGGPSNRRKSSGPNQLEQIALAIKESDARSIRVQLKSAAKLSTVSMQTVA